MYKNPSKTRSTVTYPCIAWGMGEETDFPRRRLWYMLASLRVKRGMGEAEDSGEGEEERVREVPWLVGSRRLYSGSGASKT